MSQKISANLKNLTDQNVETDIINSSGNQGFSRQEREIFIYECKDFYNQNRATITNLDNQIFFWKSNLIKKRNCYILNETKDNTSFGFNTSVVGNALSYELNMNELLDTENRTFIITFEELKVDTKLENIFYITRIDNKNTGSKELDYIYNLASLGSLELGQSSYIKVLLEKGVPENISGRIKRIEIEPKQKWLFGGFDSNVKCRVSNVIPLWTNILKVSNGTIDYINMWENDKWLLDWKTLNNLSTTNTITLKKTVSLDKLFTFNNKIFTPGVEIVKKVLQLNLSAIRRFEGLSLSANINNVGENPGIFWRGLLDGKGGTEIAGVLNTYIQEELKLWKKGSYRGEIENNNPFGKIKPFEKGIPAFSNNILNRTLSVLCMLSSQIYSPYSLLGGRNEASKFLLPYDLEIDESLTQYNNELGVFEFSKTALDNIEITSGYLNFGYRLFNEEQIKEYNETKNVIDYDSDGETPEEKFGAVNPYLRIGDFVSKTDTIDESYSVNSNISYTRSAVGSGSSDVYGFGNNPVVYCLSTFNESKEEWKQSELGTIKYKPVKLVYSYQTLDGFVGGNLSINFSERNASNLSVITFNDIENFDSIIVGYLDDKGPQPKAEDYNELKELGYKMDEAIKKVASIPYKERVVEILNEVRNDKDKQFIGTPVYEFTIKGNVDLVAIGPLREWDFLIDSVRLRAVIIEGNSEILDTIAKRKGITRAELEQQILENNTPKFKNLELENEGLRIEVIDQFFKTDVMEETITEQTYITLPVGITGDNVSKTWVFLNNVSTLDNTLEKINTEKQLSEDSLVSQKFTINLLENKQLDYIKLFGIFSSVCEVSFILDNESKLTYTIILGDRSDESNTSTNLVLDVKEQEI